MDRKLIELSPRGKVIFVGDTHGDLEASKKVFEKYSGPNTKLVFLGDYVDRGPKSRENIDYLLSQRDAHPRKVYLLQGNHERIDVNPVVGADFWGDFSKEDFDNYLKVFSKMPLAVSVGNVFASHAAIPKVNSLNDLNHVEDGGREWYDLTWADIFDKDYYRSRQRPKISERQVYSRLEKLNKEVLIRAHDPQAPTRMAGGKVVTLMTTCAYKYPRKIAIADFDKKEICGIDDLVIEEI